MEYVIDYQSFKNMAWILATQKFDARVILFHMLNYCITGIVRGRKVSRIAFFAIVREKTFAIQAISYIKIPAEIKSARKHSRMLPDSRNFSSVDDSCYTVIIY